MTRDEAIDCVLRGLSHLILTSATSVASQQNSQKTTADSPDEFVSERKDFFLSERREFVGELRRFRQDFENLISGLS